MKLNKFLFIILIISILPLNYSCEDVLDKNDLTGMASDLVWEDEAYVEAYVSTLYNQLRGWVDSYSGGFRVMDDIADEGRSGYASFLPNSIMLPGLLTAEMDDQIHDMHYWQMYKEIRSCNEFFSNMENSSLDSKEIKTLTAEVRFIRAFHYFELVKRYGGVPLILIPQKLDDPDIFPARNSTDECFNFIVDEFDKAAKTFEEVDVIKTDNARASQGAALAFKARALLYYASPQFNTGNEVKRWQNAAEAAKAVIDLGVYSLDPDFSQICRRANNELIFKKEYKLHSNPSAWVKYDHGRSTGYLPLAHARGDAGYSYPVQEFVDAFRMKNGLNISDGASGYDPKHPYSGRDPRFYSSVTYNGSVFMGDTVWTYVGSPPGLWGDGISANPFTTNTGYFCRKMIKEDLPDNYWGFRDDDTPFPFMRYADVLLMYAEAENEVSGPGVNVFSTIQQIWDRAGLTGNVPSGLSKDEMRTFIHNERYVELSFEEQRYWDLRRWDEAKTRLSGSKFHGMRITLDTLGTAPLVLDTIYTQVEVDIFVPEFKPYMNFLPIPYSEMLANPNLQQNPGW
jgi:hypothetical protein